MLNILAHSYFAMYHNSFSGHGMSHFNNMQLDSECCAVCSCIKNTITWEYVPTIGRPFVIILSFQNDCINCLFNYRCSQCTPGQIYACIYTKSLYTGCQVHSTIQHQSSLHNCLGYTFNDIGLLVYICILVICISSFPLLWIYVSVNYNGWLQLQTLNV